MGGNSASDFSNSFKGTVLRSTGSSYRILLEDGSIEEAVLRGKIRLKGFKSTNPVCVGDVVVLEREKDALAIVGIEERKNFIPRKSVNLSSRMQLLCANVDQAILLFTLEHPVTTLGYADRILATCEAFDVTPVIVFNKVDLLDTPELQNKLQDFENLYQKAGYRCIRFSSTDASSRELAISILKGKVSFVVGRSGSGKSTFINLAEPSLNLRTGEVSDFSGRGKHTTTFAEMHLLSFGGSIIDMPGFKEMETWGLEPSGLDQCFPEMIPFAGSCRFSDCRHVSEPGCAVLAAVEEGKIPSSRYYAYLGILEELARNEAEDWLGPEHK